MARSQYLRSQYLVVPAKDRWLIRFEGEDFGPYKTRSEAILFAVDAAQKLGEHGKSSQVCVRGEDGRFYQEWTFGRKKARRRRIIRFPIAHLLSRAKSPARAKKRVPCA